MSLRRKVAAVYRGRRQVRVNPRGASPARRPRPAPGVG